MKIASGRKRRSPELDITPLIDVVFILLLFFMVTTTFERETQLKVDLPEAREQPHEDEELDQVHVAIDASGRFYVDDEELVSHDLETLKRALQKAVGEREDPRVLVKSDKAAPFQAAITLMDTVAQLGLHRVRFVAQRTSEAE